jgi:hypothetical protein
MATIRIRIVVFENDMAIDEANINYYEGQPYRVDLVTPDGTDLRLPMDGFYNAGVDAGVTA